MRMTASKFCSAPVSMRFDGDDIHVLYPGGSRWFRDRQRRAKAMLREGS